MSGEFDKFWSLNVSEKRASEADEWRQMVPQDDEQRQMVGRVHVKARGSNIPHHVPLCEGEHGGCGILGVPDAR